MVLDARLRSAARFDMVVENLAHQECHLMRAMLEQLRDALNQGEERIFCQVIETRGSTPQKAGAVMVVDPLGGQLGTLGGGCVEAEVKQKAIRRIGASGAELHDFLLDHDYAWADGLICGGRMVILAEAIRGEDMADYIEARLKLEQFGDGYTEAVVTDPGRAGIGPLGARFLFDPTGQPRAAWPRQPIPDSLVARIEPLTSRPRPSSQGGLAQIPVLPRIRLIIVGAGHVGQAVASLAAQCDFDLCIVDDRAQYANPERFPEAQTILVGPIEQVLTNLRPTPRCFAVIVTRGHGHDQEALHHLAATPAAYVGLIGSRRKIRLIFEGLRAQGIPEQALRRVAAPIGLDIGSQTVPEIAVSIVAELVAARNLGTRPQSSLACAEHLPDEVSSDVACAGERG